MWGTYNPLLYAQTKSSLQCRHFASKINKTKRWAEAAGLRGV